MRKMKVFLSLLLALCLLCSVTMAEADGITAETHIEISEERALDLILSLSDEEDTEIPAENKQQLDGIFGLINALGEKVTLADNGAELDLTLTGEPLFGARTVIGEDLVLYTDLLPSYAFVLKAEDLQSLLSDLNVLLADLGSFDLQAYADIITGYIDTLNAKTEQTVTVKEGILYTGKTTVIITEKGLAQTFNALIERFYADAQNTAFAPMLPPLETIPVEGMDESLYYVTAVIYTNDQDSTRVELLDSDNGQQFSLVKNGTNLSFTAGEDADEGFDGFICTTAEGGLYTALNIHDRYDPVSFSLNAIPTGDGFEFFFDLTGEDNIGFTFCDKITIAGDAVNMLMTLDVKPVPYRLPEGFKVTAEIAVVPNNDTVAAEMTVTTSPVGELFPQGLLLKTQGIISADTENNLLSAVSDVFFMDMEQELIHEEDVMYPFEGEITLPDMTNMKQINLTDLLNGSADTETLLQDIAAEFTDVTLPALLQKVGTLMPDELNAVITLLGGM